MIAYGIEGASDTFVTRFWSKVDKNGPPPAHRPELGPCWLWTRATSDFGYGVIGRAGRGTGLVRSNRAAWELCVGPVPDGMFVLHKCDVPRCCNPSHMFLGTLDDNHKDMSAKGRATPPPRNPHLVGEAHYAAKLTADDVRTIRTMAADGPTYEFIAMRFQTTSGHVSRIVNRIAWKHVP